MKDHKETKDTTTQHKIHQVTGPDLVLAGEVHRLVEHERCFDELLTVESHIEAIAYLDHVIASSRDGIRELTSDWTPYPGRWIAKNPEQRARAFAGHLDELRSEPHLYYNTTSAVLRLGPVLVDTELATTYQLMRAQRSDDLEMLRAVHEQLLIRTRDTLKKWISAQQVILETNAPWLDSTSWALEFRLEAPTKTDATGEMFWLAHPRAPVSTKDST